MKLSEADTDRQPVPLVHRDANATFRVTNHPEQAIKLVPETKPLGEETETIVRTDTVVNVEEHR